MSSGSRVVVVFVSRRTSDHPDEYGEMSARMVELARQQRGFIDMVSVRDPITRQGVTVAWFDDEESVLAWKRHPEHQEAQRRGIVDFYDDYDVSVAQEFRHYRFEKEQL